MIKNLTIYDVDTEVDGFMAKKGFISWKCLDGMVRFTNGKYTGGYLNVFKKQCGQWIAEWKAQHPTEVDNAINDQKIKENVKQIDDHRRKFIRINIGDKRLKPPQQTEKNIIFGADGILVKHHVNLANVG